MEGKSSSLEDANNSTTLHVSKKKQHVEEEATVQKLIITDVDSLNLNASQLACWARELVEATGLGSVRHKGT